jgi:hypothetical protein
MTDALEQELRAALAEHAAAMQVDDAAERLHQIDYGAESHSWRRRLPPWMPLWPAVGAAAAASIAGICTAVVLLSSGTTAAYAGWSAVPTTPSAPALAAATATCKEAGGPLFSSAVVGRLVLTDERGRYIAELFTSGIDTGICITDGKSGHTSVGGDSLVLGFYAAPGPDQLGIPGGGGGSAPGFAAAGSATNSIGTGANAGVEIHSFGRAGSDIAALKFVFSDGSTVDATVENGWYFAWWPNLNQPASVRVTTRSGLTLSSQMPSVGCRPGSGACSLFAGFQAHPALPLGTGTSPRPRPGVPTPTTPTQNTVTGIGASTSAATTLSTPTTPASTASTATATTP